MSYREDKIYPAGTEVLFEVYSGHHMPLDARRAMIGTVISPPNPRTERRSYLIEAPEGIGGYSFRSDGTKRFQVYADPYKVMTPEDYIKYRENIRADIQFREILKGQIPTARAGEDYEAWVRDAYERSRRDPFTPRK